MKNYTSTSGKQSGVIGYELGRDRITVNFRNGSVYTYSYTSAGKDPIKQMKKLARAQCGLSTFIARNKPGVE